MIYDGHDLSPWLRCNPQRPILPPVENSTQEVPGRDGARLVRSKLGTLAIPVKVRLKARRGDDVSDLRHMLAAMLRSEEPAPLVLPDDPTRYHLAVLDGSSDLDRLWYTGSAELTFLCPDPVAYGEARKAAMGASVAVNVAGTHPTAPVITARPGSASRYRVTLRDTGEHVEVSAAFNASSVLVIDCAAQHCTVNGASADRYVALSSDYFDLAPGLNRIAATSGTAVVEWRERWL